MRLDLLAILITVIAALVVLPLVGRPPVIRVSVVLLIGAMLAVITVRPWRWRQVDLESIAAWSPSSRAVWTAMIVVGLLVFWFVLTRFESGEINAVDFTVYYDRPAFQTLHGRPMFVETSDDPARANQTYFSVHAHWAMLPLSLFYAIRPTPLWFLALSVIAVVAGARHVLRIVQRSGTSGVVASASALAFVLNANTARTLNYGFHVEVLYAWLIPWLIDAAQESRRVTFVVLAILCVSIKEDAVLLLAAVSMALALTRFGSMTRGDRLVYLVMPPLLALANLALYFGYVVPMLRPGGAPFYSPYWSSFGATPGRAVLGMLAQPWRVVSRTLTSGFFKDVLAPHLYLPLIAWRWMLGVIPIVLLYGASDNEQLRSYGIYYSIVLVPFLVIGTAVGATAVARRIWTDPTRAQLAAGTAIVLGALIAGVTDAGYSLRPWKPEIAAVPNAIARLDGEGVVLVQSGLYPHAGYDSRIQLLTPDALADPRNANAIVLLAPAVSAWPFRPEDLSALIRLTPISAVGPGLIAVRLPRR